MELNIFIKGKKEPLIYIGDRIDLLDFILNGVKYKQIRVFKNGFSKSELIKSSLINKTQEKN
ncbi:hypothetical protein [Clostridium septicum]|uniref:Uncharacterized protein n=1 Tax=Clostridium septicum TaxID=1504 RepID=A0A9N7JIP7_CLOSE|nr:hypothetical protein [Clostridium septicum]AYE32980.1 hypothetical protein CP523_00195 [Clostridium septicum]QAS61152.1 hypothetical protein EI377_10695 [Clostridium septicum]UEC19505.1 hypothetical protein LK444_08705 [Clostridium septicum]USR99542.1 hypothetical protein NH397_08480 [Clostridium septicum]WLF68057.1 hypothetical protein Q6375_08670 [Clostridium septicum]